MKQASKRCAAWLLSIFTLLTGACAQPLEPNAPIDLSAPSALLMEADTGAIIFEQNADERRQAASVTKLMTLLIVFEALDAGELKPDAPITVSENAAGQIGSQALLDAGAVYPLETLLHATIIASANDAACALAEQLSGTESAFAERMNARAAELGMANTRYTNATGLPDDAQYTTARDVATLSREVCRHADYFTHARVWMDTLTHPSGRTTDLTNTNRLVRFYDGCDGLKTGSADASRYCLSATAERNGMRLIAVVLGAPTSQQRFNDARAMLDYGFANYQRVTVLQRGDLLGMKLPVRMGMADEVEIAAGSGVSMLLKPGQAKGLKLEVELPDEARAPVAAGETLGVVRVLLDGQVIARLPAVAAREVGMPGLVAALLRIAANWENQAGR